MLRQIKDMEKLNEDVRVDFCSLIIFKSTFCNNSSHFPPVAAVIVSMIFFPICHLYYLSMDLMLTLANEII